MSDDEVDEDLLVLLRKSLGQKPNDCLAPAKTRVLEDAEFIYDNSTDVAIDMQGTKAAAASIYRTISEKAYSTQDWSKHELHPKAKDNSTVDFIFTLDLLNFCFWSDAKDTEERFAVDYRGKRWTGYWSLVAVIQRALDEGTPITSPSFWIDEDACTDKVLKHLFRSSTNAEIPLLEDRIYCLREAGYALHERFNGKFANCVADANSSAPALVNLMVDNFPCLDDRHRFEGQNVRFFKRAQIMVADLWACFEGKSYGSFKDISQITMFADYRIPQILRTMGCLYYSPPLESHIRKLRPIESGNMWELQLRGCSIWCVELIRREISRHHPETQINAVLLDFFLYDTMKEMEANGIDAIPHHRTRSVWY